MNWYAIYTKPRHEQPVASRLQDIGIEVLNPQIKSRKYKQNRLTDVLEPLFPCYLFAHFGKKSYSRLITYTRGVRYILGKSDTIAVHNEIIKTTKDRMTDGSTVSAESRKFSAGERVIIRDGPFTDFQGIFESQIKGSERVLILLEAISYRIELDSCLLTKA